jgi:AraC-like DNA-binding protein
MIWGASHLSKKLIFPWFYKQIVWTGLCSSLITPLIGFANVYDRNQWLTYFPFGIAYSSGVCIWFYVLTLTNTKRKFELKDWLAFIPSALFIISRLVLFAQTIEFKDWFNKSYYLPVVNPFVAVTEFIWNVALLYFSIRHYRKYRAWLNENFSDTELIKFNWLRNFLYLFAFVFILSAVFNFTESFLFRLSYIQYFYFEFVLALVTYYLAVAGYLRSQTIELNFTETESEELESTAGERKGRIPESELEDLQNRLQRLMETGKPFLDSQLTLSSLAKQMGVNTTVLSYVINSGFKKNFNDFVNEFRIAQIKNKLQDGAAKNLNLLGIAFDSGFNSKTTFNRAFKKFTGVSPKEYQESAAAKKHDRELK